MSTVDDSVAIADDIAGQSFALEESPVCIEESEHPWTRCEAAFVAGDYRDVDGVIRRAPGVPVSPRTTYRLPFSVWLPRSGAAPFAAVLYGHGVGGDRNQVEPFLELAVSRGIAVVAMDTLEHGEHPTNQDGLTGPSSVLRFFTVGDPRTRTIHATRLRDNFRQATYDKLQLLSLLRAGLDLTGDGRAEIDHGRLAYLGVSLGGMMTPELAALSDDFSAVVVAVGGSHISSIMSESVAYSGLISALRPASITEGDFERLFPIVQTVLDRADPASYAPHVLRDRIRGGAPPSMLLGVALDDGSMPNTSTYALARVLDVPMIGPVLRPVPDLTMGPSAPVRGNRADGSITAGLLQFDVVRAEDTSVAPATHDNLPFSEVGMAAWLSFVEPVVEGDAPEVIDAYSETGLMHAE
jgi:dienelactone hydrolase